MCKEQERQGVTATRFARRKGGSQKPTLLILVDTLAPRRGMTADASTCNLVGVKNMILKFTTCSCVLLVEWSSDATTSGIS